MRNNTRGCLTKASQTCRQQITFGDFCSNVHTSTAHLSPFPPTHHMRPCTGLQGCRGTTPCSGKTGIAGECFEGRTPSSTTLGATASPTPWLLNKTWGVWQSAARAGSYVWQVGGRWQHSSLKLVAGADLPERGDFMLYLHNLMGLTLDFD